MLTCCIEGLLPSALRTCPAITETELTGSGVNAALHVRHSSLPAVAPGVGRNRP